MSHPSVQITEAIEARLSEDDDLREALAALLPGESGNPDGLRRKTSQPLNQTDLNRRFSAHPGPKGSPTFPLVLWRRVGDPSGGESGCGTLGPTRTRMRVYVVDTGRDMEAMDTAATLIGTLLSGYTSDGVTFAADAPWYDNPVGEAGDYVELGWEFIVTHRGIS